MLNSTWILPIILSVVVSDAEVLEADVVIYDATPAGISAAISARRAGVSVLLISPHHHIGGLTTSGLGATDVGAAKSVGGIGREFYRAVRDHYDQDSHWTRQKRTEFRGRGHARGETVAWTFEPHVAEQILESMLSDAEVRVIRGVGIDRSHAMKTRSIPWRLMGLRLLDGRSVRGKIFIDASYEGDLLPMAGVPFTVGREANDQHDETLDGVQLARATKHQFATPVSAHVDPDDRGSPLLPGIVAEPHPADGSSDDGIQAYCFRMCLTDDGANQLPWTAPEGYDPGRYELLLRTFDGGASRVPWHIVAMPNRKSDVNNNGAVSTDFIGGNHHYIEATDEVRLQIINDHRRWQQGLIWTLATHPRVPEQVRKETNRWRPAADEFTDNDGWPWRIYVREGRRMLSTVVMNENHVRGEITVEDSIGLASYGMDSHHVHRRAVDGFVRNEGDVQVGGFSPWPISYRAIVPPPRSCSNLIVPVAISSTHIAFGSARMEPVYFMLGESAGIAAALSIDNGIPVQGIDYSLLRSRLEEAGQVLSWKPPQEVEQPIIEADDLEGIVIDELDANLGNYWSISTSVPGFVGVCYHHSEHNTRAAYTFKQLPVGRWKLRLRASPHENRCPQTALRVRGIGDPSLFTWKIIDQREAGEEDGWHVISEFSIDEPRDVQVSLHRISPQGHIIADAVQAIPLDR